MIKNDELAQNSLEPPFTDRGVVNTCSPSQTCITKGLNDEILKPNFAPLEMLFDWLQFTIQGHNVDQVLYNLFCCKRDTCLHTPSGRFGYNHTLTFCEKIHIMWHDCRVDMGIHVLLSGSACRTIEDLMDWKTFFNRVMMHCIVKFTRVDVAIDCYKKYFDVLTLRRKLKRGELLSKFKQGTYMEQLKISDGTQESASLKFGSMSSDIYIVFYDKLSERKNAGYIVDASVDFWVRCELRFKSDLANKLITLYLQNDYILGSYVQKILYNYLDFKTIDNSNKNKNRWNTAPFWFDFLGVVDKMSIAPKATQSTIQRKQNWANMQWSKVAVMLSVVDNDFYKNLLDIGHVKIKQSDLDIVNAHFISQNMKPITMDDFTAIYNNYINQSNPAFKPLESKTGLQEQLRFGDISSWQN